MRQVWRNGRLAPGDATPGVFPVGARFFETLALRQCRVECLDDHLERLRAGLAHLGLQPGPLAAGDLAAWRAAVAALGSADAILRVVVGEGLEELGARPILASPEAFSLRTLATRRDAPEWLPRPKSAPWANSLAATAELRSLGVAPGVEGVQLDARGHVSECSRSSLAWIADGRLCVPAAATGRLPGTALAQLILCAGLPLHEVVELPPRAADAVLVVRSTLPGGGARAVDWSDTAGHVFWRERAPDVGVAALARLAAYRAQRAVSLA